jgi:hypothetical protein
VVRYRLPPRTQVEYGPGSHRFRRGDTLKGFNDFYLKVEAEIYP